MHSGFEGRLFILNAKNHGQIVNLLKKKLREKGVNAHAKKIAYDHEA